MNNEPLVSIVTPVYNSEAYIAECVESALAQTYAHFEYIVVDNCSTDSTPEIVTSYAERDSRIRLLRPDEFVGAGSNANRALREISPSSAYVKVVHADDWLFPDCLTRMVAVAAANPTVGIVGAYRLEGTEVTLDGLPITLEVVRGATSVALSSSDGHGDTCSARRHLFSTVPISSAPDQSSTRSTTRFNWTRKSVTCCCRRAISALSIRS